LINLGNTGKMVVFLTIQTERCGVVIRTSSIFESS